MDPTAAKFIGAGLACFALIGAGIGIGNIFGNYLSGALRPQLGTVHEPADRLCSRQATACSATLSRSSSCSVDLEVDSARLLVIDDPRGDCHVS